MATWKMKVIPAVLMAAVVMMSTLGQWVSAAKETPKNYEAVSPMALVKETASYLNKDVTFEGEFTTFSTLGLDYKPALRESKDYVSVLIRRPDVKHHTIPLSELKMFFPRKKGEEEVLNLEPGDRIRVKGHVFNSALGDPWLDIDVLEITKKAKKKQEPAKSNCC